MPPPFWACAATCKAKVVFPLDSGPKISIIRPRGIPCPPKAISNDKLPVRIPSTQVFLSAPNGMIEPSPNCFSICCRAVFRFGFSLKTSLALLFSLAALDPDLDFFAFFTICALVFWAVTIIDSLLWWTLTCFSTRTNHGTPHWNGVHMNMYTDDRHFDQECFTKNIGGTQDTFGHVRWGLGTGDWGLGAIPGSKRACAMAGGPLQAGATHYIVRRSRLLEKTRHHLHFLSRKLTSVESLMLLQKLS